MPGPPRAAPRWSRSGGKVRVPTRVIRNVDPQFRSMHATCSSVVIQSFGWVMRCLGREQGKKARDGVDRPGLAGRHLDVLAAQKEVVPLPRSAPAGLLPRHPFDLEVVEGEAVVRQFDTTLSDPDAKSTSIRGMSGPPRRLGIRAAQDSLEKHPHRSPSTNGNLVHFRDLAVGQEQLGQLSGAESPPLGCGSVLRRTLEGAGVVHLPLRQGRRRRSVLACDRHCRRARSQCDRRDANRGQRHRIR